MGTDDRADAVTDAVTKSPRSEGRRSLVVTSLLVIAIAAFWRFMVTGNGLLALVAAVAWAGMLWLEVVPKIRQEWQRRGR
jgi:hypothetical protein